MANRHFAKLADVWKHLPLVAVLSIERPRHYWESHAGNALYSMVDDAERRYGALRFVDVASAFPALARSRYIEHLQALNPSMPPLHRYPGSPLLAMTELGAAASYLFCDTDVGSVADLEAAASRLGLEDCVRVVCSDGMTALHESLVGVDGKVVAHIDPYDPWAQGPAGVSAVGLARELIQRGVGLVYWYGYDGPEQRGWAFDELRESSSAAILWCGDVMIASHEKAAFGGDLGDATTPGTGFGVVCANVSREAINACRRLGEELARAYDGIPLPDGMSGHLDFTVRFAPGSS
jgi:23S rRNA A2030 N6-methylase RlmJ